MADKLKISCMIPCYNEEECIERTARELAREFQKLPQDCELVFIDHGSADRTLEQLKKVEKDYPSLVRTIRVEKNIGYGGIINYGLKEFTKGDIIGWTCADGEITAEDTRKLVEFLLNHPEYAAVKSARINRNRGFRKFISIWYNRLVKVFFDIDTEDINGWPFFIKSDVYHNLGVQSTNWIINIEILDKLQKKNFKFKDIDCIHQQRKGGRSKVHLFTIVAFLYQVLGYKVRAMRGK